MQYECVNLIAGCTHAHKEALAAKRALDTTKQQTLDEASKEILAIVVGDDKGCSAEDDDDEALLMEGHS